MKKRKSITITLPSIHSDLHNLVQKSSEQVKVDQVKAKDTDDTQPEDSNVKKYGECVNVLGKDTKISFRKN